MPEIKQLFSSPRCQHVHYSGRPCKAPARRGRNFCVFHQAAHLDPGGCTIPVVEDLHSYQLAIIRIMQSLAADAIDSKKATALLYALQLLGGKLNDFASQRDEVENPAASLRKEVGKRYDARKNPFPSYIPDKDVVAILKEISAEGPAEPDDAIEVIPQSVNAAVPGDGIRTARCSPVLSSGTDASVPGLIDKLEACDSSGATRSALWPTLVAVPGVRAVIPEETFFDKRSL
jgi:hypothetical protein